MTGHCPQTRRAASIWSSASPVVPMGKKSSGVVSRQAARSRHSCASQSWVRIQVSATFFPLSRVALAGAGPSHVRPITSVPLGVPGWRGLSGKLPLHAGYVGGSAITRGLIRSYAIVAGTCFRNRVLRSLPGDGSIGPSCSVTAARRRSPRRTPSRPSRGRASSAPTGWSSTCDGALDGVLVVHHDPDDRRRRSDRGDDVRRAARGAARRSRRSTKRSTRAAVSS